MSETTFNPDNVLLLNAKSGVVPDSQGELIIKDIISNSAVMQIGKYVDMNVNGKPVLEKKFSYLAKGVGAYWVEEGKKIQTSKPEWVPATLKAHKLGVIIPVSREYLTYSLPDFFEYVKPLVVEAFYKKFDEAVILGSGSPFDNSIDKASKNQLVEGDINYDNILALEDKLIENNFEGNSFISKVSNKTLLRGAVKNSNGVSDCLFDRNSNILDGLPVVNVFSDEMKKGTLYLLDSDYLFYGIPYNLTYEVSTDATLTTIKDNDEFINLFERELMALRCTMDVGCMIVNDKAFAKLAPKAASSDSEHSESL
ncbi:MAG: phage major capsid protein [Peptoniphilaceae bacterium]|nr:phage major capsid protein [Peptoniphilaceae bacterium]